MKLSLQAKASIFITLVIIIISIVSTYLFTSAHRSSKERGLAERGEALSYALSKAAEEGLIHENLDLIKKASNIIRAPDVTLAQVYSDIWEAVDAYPFGSLKRPPHPGAVSHFKRDSSPLRIKLSDGYDFYSPIMFRATEDSPPVNIGFVRIELSSSRLQRELKGIVATGIAVSALITIFAILSINMLIHRLVVKPVTVLYKSVLMFKSGKLPDTSLVSGHSADEIKELSREFYAMCTAIQEKESRIIESEKRIKSLFERVEHAIFRLDKSAGIIETNARFKEMFGNVSRLCDILLKEREAADCLQMAASEKTVHREERAVGIKGGDLTILLSLYAESGGDGIITGYDGYIIDITEKKRLEERLLRSQKLEAVGTLAGGMAHEFNNLLAAVLGYSEIMMDMTKEGEPFYKPAYIIHSAAERGADLAKKILSVTRKEKMEMGDMDINEIVKTSVELLRGSISRNVEITLRLEEGIPNTIADPSQIQQVILNLAVNARDAMPDGGKLLIETEMIEHENSALKGAPSERGGFIRLSVSDTGIGMSREMQAKIFDPFFTTKEIGKGTGLGLYIVYSIVDNHGGYINLYSEEGMGTRFNIYLPVTKGKKRESSHEAHNLRGSETILVIDDETYIREMCKDILAPLGYEVLLARNGVDGIETFSRIKDKVSLVILDMVMPEMGGSEVFSALREMKSGQKILLCSGYSANGFAGIDRLMKSGADGFVQKPFSRDDIARAIRKALAD